MSSAQNSMFDKETKHDSNKAFRPTLNSKQTVLQTVAESWSNQRYHFVTSSGRLIACSVNSARCQDRRNSISVGYSHRVVFGVVESEYSCWKTTNQGIILCVCLKRKCSGSQSSTHRCLTRQLQFLWKLCRPVSKQMSEKMSKKTVTMTPLSE